MRPQERTKAAPSQTRPIAPCELPSTVSLLRCPQSPHGGAQIVRLFPGLPPLIEPCGVPAVAVHPHLLHEAHSDDLAHLVPQYLRPVSRCAASRRGP